MKQLLWIALVGALALGGCDKKPAPDEAQQPAEGEVPAPPAPKIKLTLGFLPIDNADEAHRKRANALTSALTSATDYDVTPMFPKSFGASIRALKMKRADAVVLSSWAYLQAHYTADADLLAADSRDGETTFSAHWYVAADSTLQSSEQLGGTRVAFTNPQSADGFLFPYALLLQQGVVKAGDDVQKAFKEISFTGSEQESFRALLAGQVDAIAASEFAPKINLSEEEQAKVRSIGEVKGVPTNVIAVRSDADPVLRASLLAAFNKIDDPAVLEVIGAQKFVERSHGDHVMTLQETQDIVGADFSLDGEAPEGEPPAAH